MGAYLSKPVTEKEFENGEDERFSFEAGSMQGWRTSQEDAHSCILDFTDDMSFFAVYDGHGGAEVAQLCAQKLPLFIKESNKFIDGNYSEALIESFLAFDQAIVTSEVQDVLKKLANIEDNKSNDDEDDDDDPSLLQEEATLPLSQLLGKYKLCMMDNGSEDDNDEDLKSQIEDHSERIIESSTNNSENYQIKKVHDVSEDVLEDDEDEEFVVGDEDEEDDEDEVDTDEESAEEDGEEDEDCVREMDNAMQDMQHMHSSPGFDSGSTAVVAIINYKTKTIYVANAGDSRCVLCRNGQAIDLSVDHKPEDDIEKARITKAGGVLSEDGRVNGGLNLSRSIGDHSYKRNKDLELQDQMISALPDVKVVDLIPAEDEFMVLACDGIWNTFSSDELTTFIKKRISIGMKTKELISEIFAHCLAPNTSGDGTGCDNMTCIIVFFKLNVPENSSMCNGNSTTLKRKYEGDEPTLAKVLKSHPS